jgi:hypothetical protein
MAIGFAPSSFSRPPGRPPPAGFKDRSSDGRAPDLDEFQTTLGKSRTSSGFSKTFQFRFIHKAFSLFYSIMFARPFRKFQKCIRMQIANAIFAWLVSGAIYAALNA